MSVSLAPPMFLQFLNPNNSGSPAVGYQLFTYIAGTTTKQATWTDSTQTAENANPLELDGNGVGNFWGDPTLAYKLVWAPANDTDPPTSPIRTVDNLYFPLTLAILNPSTPAEKAISATVVNPLYGEGDIRRYGALVTLVDNSFAINTALAVSAAGGAAAYIPGTTTQWNITSQVNASGSSSIHGDGVASLIVCTGCGGIAFGAQTFEGASRFFRDFVLQGSSTTSSTYDGITIGSALGTGRILGIVFSNLTILNFAYAVHLNNPTGIWNSVFSDCFFYNCYQGYYLNGQAIGLDIRGGFVFCGASMTGSGTRYGVFTAANSGGDVQALNMAGVGVYAYDVSVLLQFTLYTTITDCNLNIYNVYGIQIDAAQGGTFIKGTWIQGATNVNNLTGIIINDLGTAINDKIVIDSCQLEGQVGTGTGSLAVYCGENNTAISILNSTIGNSGAPFANGIAGLGGYIETPNVNIDDNAFYVTGTCVSVGTSLGINCKIGQNVVQNGTYIAFSGLTPTGFSLEGKGSFTLTLTGMTGTTTTTVNWAACNHSVTLSVGSAGVAGTSNATTMTGTGLPAYLWPVTDQTSIFNVIDNGASQLGSGVIAAASGTITFKKDFNGTAFTGTGVKGLNGLNSTYSFL